MIPWCDAGWSCDWQFTMLYMLLSYVLVFQFFSSCTKIWHFCSNFWKCSCFGAPRFAGWPHIHQLLLLLPLPLYTYFYNTTLSCCIAIVHFLSTVNNHSFNIWCHKFAWSHLAAACTCSPLVYMTYHFTRIMNQKQCSQIRTNKTPQHSPFSLHQHITILQCRTWLDFAWTGSMHHTWI